MTAPLTPTVVALPQLAAELIADLPHHAGGRAARTILTGPTMRAVILAIGAGNELAEHEAPGAATLYCIAGDVTVRTHTEEWRVRSGEHLPVPGERHAVVAHADSAVLLTVALR